MPLTNFERIRQEAATIGGGGRYDHLRGGSASSRFKELQGESAPRRGRFEILDEDPLTATLTATGHTLGTDQ